MKVVPFLCTETARFVLRLGANLFHVSKASRPCEGTGLRRIRLVTLAS